MGPGLLQHAQNPAEERGKKWEEQWKEAVPKLRGDTAISLAVQHIKKRTGNLFCSPPAGIHAVALPADTPAPRQATPSLDRYSIKIKPLSVSTKLSLYIGPSYSRAFPRLLKFSLSIQDRLERSGFEHAFNIKRRLKGFAAGGREGCFVCSMPCPVWEDVAPVCY